MSGHRGTFWAYRRVPRHFSRGLNDDETRASLRRVLLLCVHCISSFYFYVYCIQCIQCFRSFLYVFTGVGVFDIYNIDYLVTYLHVLRSKAEMLSISDDPISKQVHVCGDRDLSDCWQQQYSSLCVPLLLSSIIVNTNRHTCQLLLLKWLCRVLDAFCKYTVRQNLIAQPRTL